MITDNWVTKESYGEQNSVDNLLPTPREGISRKESYGEQDSVDNLLPTPREDRPRKEPEPISEYPVSRVDTILATALTTNYFAKYLYALSQGSGALMRGMFVGFKNVTASTENYPVYKDIRFSDPNNARFAHLFRGVTNDTENDEVWDYVNLYKHSEQIVRDKGNIFLSLGIGTLTPDVILPIRLANVVGSSVVRTAKTFGIGAWYGSLSFGIDYLANLPISPEMSSEEIKLSVAASLLFGGAIHTAVSGVGGRLSGDGIRDVPASDGGSLGGGIPPRNSDLPNVSSAYEPEPPLRNPPVSVDALPRQVKGRGESRGGVGSQSLDIYGIREEVDIPPSRINNFKDYRRALENNIDALRGIPADYKTNFLWKNGKVVWNAFDPLIPISTSARVEGNTLIIKSNDLAINGATSTLPTLPNGSIWYGAGNGRLGKHLDSFYRFNDSIATVWMGTFLGQGITDTSALIRNLTSLIFHHDFVTKGMLAIDTPKPDTVQGLIGNDRFIASKIVRNAEEGYNAISYKLLKQGYQPKEKTKWGSVIDLKEKALEITDKTVRAVSGSKGLDSIGSGNEIADFTYHDLSVAITHYFWGVPHVFDKAPKAYHNLITKVASEINEHFEVLRELAIEVGFDMPKFEGRGTGYLTRRWKEELLQIPEEYNALVHVMEPEIRKQAIKDIRTLEGVILELEQELDKRTRNIEKPRNQPHFVSASTRHKRQDADAIYKKYIGENKMEAAKFEEKLIKASEQLDEAKRLALPAPTDPNKINYAKVKAIWNTKEIRDGKVHVNDIMNFSKDEDKTVKIKPASLNKIIIAGHSSVYTRWLHDDVFALYQGYLHSTGAQLRLLQVLQGAGFEDGSKPFEALKEEELETIKRNSTGVINKQELIDISNKVKKNYVEKQKFLEAMLLHSIDRYKDTSGEINAVSRAFASWHASTSLNAVPLTMGMDIANIVKNHGIVPSIKHIVEATLRRIKNITKADINRDDPYGYFIDNYVLNLEDNHNYLLESSAGKELNTFGRHADGIFIETIATIASSASRASGVELLNNLTRKLSARLTLSYILDTAERLQKGTEIKSKDLYKIKSLGLERKQLLEFYNEWQTAGGRRSEPIVPWGKGVPIGDFEKWNPAILNKLNIAVRNSVNFDVFNVDKAVQSRLTTKSNIFSLLGLFFGYLAQGTTKITHNLAIKLLTGNKLGFFEGVIALLVGGYLTVKLREMVNNSEFWTGEHRFIDENPRSGKIFLDAVNESDVLGGVQKLVALALIQIDAYQNEEKADSTELITETLGTGALKVKRTWENTPLAFVGDSEYKRAKGWRTIIALVPYQNSWWIKPVQSTLVDKLTELGEPSD